MSEEKATASATGNAIGAEPAAPTAPANKRGYLRLLGPGIVLALASVGASDMVTTLNSGAEYGLALVWVFLVGLILKYALSEAIARLQLTADRSFLSHAADVGGRFFPVVLLIAELLVGLFFGAGVASITTRIVQEIFPGLPFWPTFVVVLGSALVLLLIGRYSIVEKAMVGFAILMFFGIVFLALGSAMDGDARQTAADTFVPVLPTDSLITVLSLIGGVGGVTGIMAYTYFVREKRWRGPEWKSVIRTDLGFSYSLVAIFALSMTAVGAFWLYGEGHTISSNDAVFSIGEMLGGELGQFVHLLFLLCFFAVTYSSLLGGFQGIAYVTGDCLRVVRTYPHQDAPGKGMSASSPEFRIALAWLTFATLLFMGTDQPVGLVLIYASISSLILPVLAVLLLILLNRKTLPANMRSGRLSNTMLVLCLVLFTFLAGVQVVETVSGLLG